MVFVIAYVWLLRAFEETNFKTFVLRQHRNSQMRSLDSTHYKYSSSWDLTFRWHMMTFTTHFRFIKRMAILLACFICFLYDKHQLYGRWKQKKYSSYTVDEVTWWLVSFFFPLENYQSRYQSLRPYNKMVMLTQLGYILKFT